MGSDNFQIYKYKTGIISLTVYEFWLMLNDSAAAVEGGMIDDNHHGRSVTISPVDSIDSPVIY